LTTNLNPHRKRITLFHVCGHIVIEYHPRFSISIERNDTIAPSTHKMIEREAFLAGSEVMFPLKHFTCDSASLPIKFASIENIAQRYTASFEATAIRYALTNQNIMAIVVVKENDLTTNLTATADNQAFLPVQIPLSTRPNTSSTIPAPLRVQYCVRSHNFPKFIKSGIEIGKFMNMWAEEGEENLIHKSWRTNLSLTGEIPASVFGSTAIFSYTAECHKINNRVFVLLSLPDKQIKLFNGANP